MLSERLLEITKLVKKNSLVADIGTDHGYVPIYLIENRIAKKVIATDISSGSLNKTIGYVKELNLEDKIDTRLGNGLDVIKPYEVDTLVIAGMGGILISEILDKNKEVTYSINNFIFQAMIGSEELRKYLIENNFKIIDERLIKEDGKYYEIINAKIGKDFIEDDIYYEIPKKLVDDKHPLIEDYIENKIKFSKDILRGLENKNTERVVERREELKIKLEEYEEVLKIVNG